MGRFRFWHVLLALGAILLTASLLDGFKFKGDHLARVHIAGEITTDLYRHEMLVKLAKDDNVKAVLVQIDSPGGGAHPSQEIYEDLRAIAAHKPVVALLGSVAASGGYVSALGADRIYARLTTITGSVGVVFQWFGVNGLAKKVGIEPYTVRSGGLKARPNPFERPNPKTLQHVNVIVKSLFTWFIDLVVLRRNIKKDKALRLVGDGRIFTGRQALEINLIDAIGGETEARQWLAAEHDIALEVPVETYEPVYPAENFKDWLLQSVVTALGGKAGEGVLLPPSVRRQGPMLLWQF